MIIVIEGTDGSGKQTQSELLFNYLKENNYNVKKQSFPNYESNSSILVKMYLNGDFGGLYDLNAKQSSTLFAVDRLATMISYKDFLKSGGILILDRYVSSNILHQASKIDDNNEREEFIRWLDNFEFEDLKPNLSQKLREARHELKSGTKCDINESDNQYMKKCYDLGIKTANSLDWQVIKCYNGDEIKTIEEIQEEIRKNVLIKLK